MVFGVIREEVQRKILEKEGNLKKLLFMYRCFLVFGNQGR